MSIDLPKPIAAYIAAENGHDRDALSQWFADDAIVKDEGRTITGFPAIKDWMAETKKKYQHTVEPLSSAQKEGVIMVTCRLAGTFPGNPIKLDFVFRLEGSKIVSLEIQ
jgi:hypothetical protein